MEQRIVRLFGDLVVAGDGDHFLLVHGELGEGRLVAAEFAFDAALFLFAGGDFLVGDDELGLQFFDAFALLFNEDGVLGGDGGRGFGIALSTAGSLLLLLLLGWAACGEGCFAFAGFLGADAFEFGADGADLRVLFGVAAAHLIEEGFEFLGAGFGARGGGIAGGCAVISGRGGGGFRAGCVCGIGGHGFEDPLEAGFGGAEVGFDHALVALGASEGVVVGDGLGLEVGESHDDAVFLAGELAGVFLLELREFGFLVEEAFAGFFELAGEEFGGAGGLDLAGLHVFFDEEVGDFIGDGGDLLGVGSLEEDTEGSGAVAGPALFGLDFDVRAHLLDQFFGGGLAAFVAVEAVFFDDFLELGGAEDLLGDGGEAIAEVHLDGAFDEFFGNLLLFDEDEGLGAEDVREEVDDDGEEEREGDGKQDDFRDLLADHAEDGDRRVGERSILLRVRG